MVRLSPSEKPVLLVVVDTEEEFDWSKPLQRSSTSVSSMRHIGRVQDIFDRYDIRPCYVVDYAVASQEEGYLPLREILDRDRCCIGAHLHPWVNPPHEETVCAFNSFPGNLPPGLERSKLEVLGREIERAFAIEPRIYKAGRYGLGPNTAQILEELGFEVDLSPASAFDYSHEGGPNFERHPNDPYWFGPTGRLLCVPCTGAFVGWLRHANHTVYRYAARSSLRGLRLPGVLARLRMVERIRLSPEGFTTGEMIRLTHHLVERGARVLTLSFHSPSVQPGCTPYVRNRQELEAFLGALCDYLEFFLGRLSGRTMTPLELRTYLEGAPTRRMPLGAGSMRREA